MNVLIVNGSPKGDKSITLQSMLFLEKKYPGHEFSYLPVGRKIKSFEKDMTEAVKAISDASLIIFSYPVYTYLVPSQLHRFIELLKEQDVSLHGKYVTQFSTSMHFFDMTAHRFMEENLKDLGAFYLSGLSAEMGDLPTKKGQKQLCDFFSHLEFQMKHGFYETASEKKECRSLNGCTKLLKTADVSVSHKPVVLITDCGESDVILRSMIDRFEARLKLPVKEVNLRDLGLKGGCLGCLNCVISEKCIYRDGFDSFLREEIQTGCAMVYAFRVKDHSMGFLFKQYDDRQFCNGHRAVTAGMPIAYLADGDLRTEDNLNTVLHARPETGGNYLAGIADSASDTDAAVDRLALELMYAIRNKPEKPLSFYGVGGNKIFRDLVYMMRGLMKADHKFYKAHGMYDFPQKKKGNILGMYLVGVMMGNKTIRKKAAAKMDEGMLMPYKKALEEA